MAIKKSVDFVIDNTALTTISNTVIDANWAEMEEFLTTMIAPYKGLVVERDQIAEAKQDRAKINKMITNIESYRKSTKKAFSVPLKSFEEKCNKLVAICKEGADSIDKQVKAFEAEEREAKIDSLKQYFENAPKEHPEYICFNDIVKPEWANKSYSAEKAHADIDLAIRQSDLDVSTIMAINKKWTPFLLEEFKQTHDLRKVLALSKKYDEIAAVQDKEQQRFAEEAKKAPVGKTQYHEVPEAVEVRPEYVKELVEEPLSITFEVTCSERKMNALQTFMDDNGITWHVV